MPVNLPPELPIDPIRDLEKWWRGFGVKSLVIGAVAVAALGKPRITHDVDGMVLLPEDRWPEFLHASAAYGFVPRWRDALAFARESRMLLLRHQPSAIDIDISFGALPFEEEAVSAGKPMDIGGVIVLLPTPEDLIIMKAVAHRDKDLIDIEGVLDRNPKVDKRRIRRWVREFAEVLDMPELLDDLERLLSRRRPRGRPKKRS